MLLGTDLVRGPTLLVPQWGGTTAPPAGPGPGAVEVGCVAPVQKGGHDARLGAEGGGQQGGAEAGRDGVADLLADVPPGPRVVGGEGLERARLAGGQVEPADAA